jgi:SHAQKYF class myb-like DNA-binding protein
MKAMRKKHKLAQDMLDTKMEVNSTSILKKRKTPKRPLDIKSDNCKDGKWTEEEHQRFLDAMELYGNIWKKVEAYIGTRSTAQIRSHAQKHFRRLRSQALAEMKKNDQLQHNVFVVVREYRNNTYNSSAVCGSLFKEEQANNSCALGAQEANNSTLEDSKGTQGKSECEQDWKIEEPVYCCSENELMAFQNLDEKSELPDDCECTEEEKPENGLDFDSAICPFQLNSHRLSFEEVNFKLFEEKNTFEDLDDEITPPALMKVKYEP